MLHFGLPTWLKVLTISCLLFFFACAFARSASYRDPGSRFFDPARAYEQHYSRHREQEAASFRDDVIAWLGPSKHNSTLDYSLAPEDASAPVGRAARKPRMCAAFITAARKEGKQYVELAVASALAGLMPAERHDINLNIYFANTDPTIHPSWDSWISKAVDQVYGPRDAAGEPVLETLLDLERKQNWYAKAGVDYTVALEHCYDHSSSPWIAIFEGDVLFADGWFARTMLTLQRLERHMSPNGDAHKWLYMRLFNQERSTGWLSHDLLGNNVPLISLGVSSVVGGVLLAIKRYLRKSHGFPDIPSILIICGLTIPSFVVLFFQTGKATMLPPGPGVRVENFGCCTQGLVFPRERIAGVVAEIREKAEQVPHDIVMNGYWRKNNLQTLALYPMQLQHIGFESIISPNRLPDQAVWSMAFESLDAEDLMHDHEKMVTELYGAEAWILGQ